MWYFEAVDDQSAAPLVSVVVIAVLAGADGPTAIVRWAALKEELLLGALDLPHGVPGRDGFLRVLGASPFFEELNQLEVPFTNCA